MLGLIVGWLPCLPPELREPHSVLVVGKATTQLSGPALESYSALKYSSHQYCVHHVSYTCLLLSWVTQQGCRAYPVLAAHSPPILYTARAPLKPACVASTLYPGANLPPSRMCLCDPPLLTTTPFPQPQHFDDRVGPLGLCTAVVLTLVTILIVSFIDFIDFLDSKDSGGGDTPSPSPSPALGVGLPHPALTTFTQLAAELHTRTR